MNCAHISPAVATAAIRDGSSLHFVRRGSHYFWILLWRYCGPGKKSLDCRIRNHVRCPPGVRPIPVYISIMVFATGRVIAEASCWGIVGNEINQFISTEFSSLGALELSK